ncbi:MAG: restriction endonuclease [Truepera sp.]|nr:restriction endonuclease [Truepera sp.]
MLPLLELAGEQKTLQFREAVNLLAQHFALTDDEVRRPLPSGQRSTFYDRVSWARTYLKKAGLLESPKRGWLRITERGSSVLGMKPPKIDNKLLDQFEEFRDFRGRTPSSRPDGPRSRRKVPEDTPKETLEKSYATLREALATDLLQTVMESPSWFFERLVVDLLVRMGYGGSLQEAGEVVGRSGDEGIDGIIKEDRLGLDVIYIQAKRWEGVVSRPEIQKFVGALQGKRARKGIFITTSTFSEGAKDYAANIETTVILIEGTRLAQLMIDYGVGVTTEASYELKRIDSDYFPEE